jgi:hypothetical protein
MDKYRKIAELLKSPPKKTGALMVGIVDSVQGETAKVNIAGTVYEDVRIFITDTPPTDKLEITPKGGSYVLIADLAGDMSALTIVDVETPERIQYTIDTLTYTIDGTGFTIEKGGENLKTILSDFMDEVMKIIVIQGTSPNIPAITAIKTRLNTILNA